MIDLGFQKLQQVKKDIRDAIEEKGVAIADENNFESYSKEIQKITGSGGGSDIETSTFKNVLNNSSKTINVGDKVFLNHVNVLSGEGNCVSDKDDVKTSNPRILSADGNFIYAPNTYQVLSYVQLDGLSVKDYSTVVNYTTNLNTLAFGPSGELLTCHLRYSSGGTAVGASEEYRCDAIYWKEASGFFNGSTRMYGGYIGEDIYIIEGHDDKKNYILKKDLETGKNLKQWVVEDSDFSSMSNQACCISVYENNKLYVYDFKGSIVYVIDEATDTITKESLSVKRLQSTDIRPVAITNDHKFLIAKTSSSTSEQLKCIRRDSVTAFTEISNLESGKLQLQGQFDGIESRFFFNRFNQILSIKYHQRNKYLILQYVGSDENDLPLFNEIRLSKPEPFNTDEYDFSDSIIPFTFNANGTKVVYSLQKTDGNFDYVIVQSLTDYSKFEVVESNLCNSMSVQGIVQKNAESGATTSVKAYKMKEATATIKTNVNAEIEIVGGVE